MCGGKGDRGLARREEGIPGQGKGMCREAGLAEPGRSETQGPFIAPAIRRGMGAGRDWGLGHRSSFPS